MENKQFTGILASVIKHNRLEKGLTQQKLADKMGKHRQAIQRAENGKHTPGVIFIKEICEALDIRLRDLFTDVEVWSNNIFKI